MSDLTDAIEAAALNAVLGAVIWSDDSNQPELRDIARDIAQAVTADVEPILRADERAKVAEEIEARLVCCDIHERIVAAMPDTAAVARLLERGNGYHAICHWGGAAAAIARGHAQPAETAVGASTAPAEGPGKRASVIRAQDAGGTPGGIVRAEHVDRARQIGDGT